MATDDSATDDAPTATTDADTVDVEVLYVRGGHSRSAPDLDPDSPLFDLHRDLTCWGADTFDRREDLTPGEAIAGAYVTVGRTTVDASEFDSTDRLLERIWARCQGDRRNDLYNGDKYRSMMVGDVVVVDGHAYMAATMGFDPLGVDYRDDQGEDTDE